MQLCGELELGEKGAGFLTEVVLEAVAQEMEILPCQIYWMERLQWEPFYRGRSS